MSEMIDKVAAALEQAFKDRVSAQAEQPFDMTGVIAPKPEVWQAYARAAIEAMRVPAPPMAATARDALNTWGIGSVECVAVYMAMIDEALK